MEDPDRADCPWFCERRIDASNNYDMYSTIYQPGCACTARPECEREVSVGVWVVPGGSTAPWHGERSWGFVGHPRGSEERGASRRRGAHFRKFAEELFTVPPAAAGPWYRTSPNGERPIPFCYGNVRGVRVRMTRV